MKRLLKYSACLALAVAGIFSFSLIFNKFFGDPSPSNVENATNYKVVSSSTDHHFLHATILAPNAKSFVERAQTAIKATKDLQDKFGYKDIEVTMTLTGKGNTSTNPILARARTYIQPIYGTTLLQWEVEAVKDTFTSNDLLLYNAWEKADSSLYAGNTEPTKEDDNQIIEELANKFDKQKYQVQKSVDRIRYAMMHSYIHQTPLPM